MATQHNEMGLGSGEYESLVQANRKFRDLVTSAEEGTPQREALDKWIQLKEAQATAELIESQIKGREVDPDFRKALADVTSVTGNVVETRKNSIWKRIKNSLC